MQGRVSYKHIPNIHGNEKSEIYPTATDRP